MKCPNPQCKAENPDGATFCRACGRKFMFIDKYSDFKFIQLKKGVTWPFAIFVVFIKLALSLLLIFLLCTTIYFGVSWSDYEYDMRTNYDDSSYFIIRDKAHILSSDEYYSYYNDNHDDYYEAVEHYHSVLLESIVSCATCSIITLILILLYRKVKISKKRTDKSLYDIADYITYDIFFEYFRLGGAHTYALIVKGDKFGIVDITDRSIHLQNLYEDAKKIGRFVCLKRNGLWCLLEFSIHGTPRMISNARFQSVSLHDSAKSLFQVTENGRTFIIDKYGKELN